MIENKIEIEHTHLLINYYPKAYPGAIPFGLVLCALLYREIPTHHLAVWLTLLILGVISQVLFAHVFNSSKVRSRADCRRWVFYASIGTCLMGVLFGYISVLSTKLSVEKYYFINYFLMSSVALFSPCGFKRVFTAYAIPVLFLLALSNTIYNQTLSFWGAALYMLGLVLFYLISNYFESTLRDSIKIRFENENLLKQLQTKNKEAEQANRAKSTFLASASHDLRQPLHALGLYVETANYLNTTAEQRHLNAKMAGSIEALNNLFDSLLDISKLDSGTIQPTVETVDIAPIIDRVVSTFESSAKEKELQLISKTENALVSTDPILLERVLSNLVSNALRYTSKGGVHITAFVSDEMLHITVKDTGIGIPIAAQERVFDEFYQLQNPERDRSKGLGLGLSIVGRLDKLLCLNLKMDSVVGYGTTFELSIPLSDSEPARHSQVTNINAANISNLKVVLLDDDIAILDAMSRLLKRWGCEAYHSTSAAKLSAQTPKGFIPDVIISDYRLADSVSGIEEIAWLREEYGATIPAILITGDTAVERLTDALVSGHRLLHKPVAPGLLRQSIIELMQSSTLRAKQTL